MRSNPIQVAQMKQAYERYRQSKLSRKAFCQQEGILKEELLEEQYLDFEVASKAVSVSIYNNERPHSSIDFLTLSEAYLRKGGIKEALEKLLHTTSEARTEELK